MVTGAGKSTLVTFLKWKYCWTQGTAPRGPATRQHIAAAEREMQLGGDSGCHEFSAVTVLEIVPDGRFFTDYISGQEGWWVGGNSKMLAACVPVTRSLTSAL